MSIATAITDLSGRIQGAYAALESKGATMPGTKDTWHLSATIDTIPAGGGSKYGCPIGGLLGDIVNGELQYPSEGYNLSFDGLSAITNTALANKFSRTGIQSARFPDLEAVLTSYGFQAFQYCGNLAYVSFPKLKSVSQNGMAGAFAGCSALTAMEFPALTSVEQQAFSQTFLNCAGLSYVTFDALETINASTVFGTCFNNTGLVSLQFDSLTTLRSSVDLASFAPFYNCTGLYSISLPKVTDIGNNVFNGCTNLAEIHFGAANRETIEATSGYSTLWGRGAGAATVYFDLY